MTVNRKQKQAVRAFAATHKVSYSEALRLMGMSSIKVTLQSDGGETYWAQIDTDVEVVWWVSDTESAAAVGTMKQWMSTADPQSSDWKKLASDGRVQAAAGSPSLWGSLPYAPADVVAQVRALILKHAPSWERLTASALAIRAEDLAKEVAGVAEID